MTTIEWNTLSSAIAAFSSLVSVIATIFIARLTARYARSADVQAEAALRQSQIASRSIEALELQIREERASRNAVAITAAVAVMVNMKIWLRLIDRSPLPQKPRLIPSALLEASSITVQFSPVDAHRMRRIFEILAETEGDLDVLRRSVGESQPQETLSPTMRRKIVGQLKAAHMEALQVVQSLAPEQAQQIDSDLRVE